VRFQRHPWHLGWESDENPISRLLATDTSCAPLLTGFAGLASYYLITGNDAIGPSPHDRHGNLYLGEQSGKNKILDNALTKNNPIPLNSFERGLL